MSWWTLPHVQANRAAFDAEWASRQPTLSARTTSAAPKTNIIMFQDEIRLKHELRRRLREKGDCVARKPVLSCTGREQSEPHGAALTEGRHTVELTRKNVLKNGSATYEIVGVKGLVRIDRKMFASGATAPATLDVNFDGFVQPDPATVAKLQERAAKRGDKAKSVAERAAKAQASADKAMARAKKLADQAAKLAGAPAAATEAAQ